MAPKSQSTSGSDAEASGLRGRKKAQRRQKILHCAERLFARDGFDATTTTAIADEAGVSQPTIFNYFGSKENILSALIIEGTEQARAGNLGRYRETGCAFGEVIGNLLCAITAETMAVAGKRVWRYAESTNIRRPNSKFQKQFDQVDAAAVDIIADFLRSYAIVLRSGDQPDPTFLARLFFDCWTTRYFEYIKDDDMPLDLHQANLRVDVEKLVSLLFDDDFAAFSPFSKTEALS